MLFRSVLFFSLFDRTYVINSELISCRVWIRTLTVYVFLSNKRCVCVCVFSGDNQNVLLITTTYQKSTKTKVYVHHIIAKLVFIRLS